MNHTKTANIPTPTILDNGEPSMLRATQEWQVEAYIDGDMLIVRLYTDPMPYAGGIHFATCSNMAAHIVRTKDTEE